MTPEQYVVTWVGWAVLLGCVTLAVSWLWGIALREIGRRCMESAQFFDLVVRYAREKNTTRVTGIDE